MNPKGRTKTTKADRTLTLLSGLEVDGPFPQILAWIDYGKQRAFRRLLDVIDADCERDEEGKPLVVEDSGIRAAYIVYGMPGALECVQLDGSVASWQFVMDVDVPRMRATGLARAKPIKAVPPALPHGTREEKRLAGMPGKRKQDSMENPENWTGRFA